MTLTSHPPAAAPAALLYERSMTVADSDQVALLTDRPTQGHSLASPDRRR